MPQAEVPRQLRVQPAGLGVLAIGSNYGHEIYATPWWSFLFGGGVGIGVVTGNLTNWAPGSSQSANQDSCLSESPSYYRKDYCPPDGSKRIPKVARSAHRILMCFPSLPRAFGIIFGWLISAASYW